MMSSAPAAFEAQNACSRAAMSCVAGMVGKHVDVERAQLGQLRGERLGVLVEPVGWWSSRTITR